MKKLLFSLLVLGLIGVALSFPSQVSMVPVAQADNDRRTLVLEVAFDGRTFVPNPVDPTATSGARGDTFVLNGKIFPGGTIPPGDGTFSPDAAGSIGTFICRGTSLFSDAEIAAGAAPFVATTQTWVLDKGNTLVTDGLEGNVSPIQRAVTGGTHEFRGASGVVTLKLLGFNATGFEDYRATFHLKRGDSD